MNLQNDQFLDRPISETDVGIILTRAGEWKVFTTRKSDEEYDPEQGLPEDVYQQGRALMRLVLAVQDPELMAELDRRLDAQIDAADALTPANLH